MVYISNTRATATTVKTRKNGADGNQSISVTTTGILQDTTNSDSIASGDLISISVTTGTGSDTFRMRHVTAELTTTDGTFNLIVGLGDMKTIPTGTGYERIGGTLTDLAAAEVNAQAKFYGGITITKLNLYCNIISGPPTVTVNLRDDGSTVNNVLSFTTTGWKEDTTHSDVIDAGSLLCTYINVAGGTNFRCSSMGALCAVAAGGAIYPDSWHPEIQQPIREKIEVIGY